MIKKTQAVAHRGPFVVLGATAELAIRLFLWLRISPMLHETRYYLIVKTGLLSYDTSLLLEFGITSCNNKILIFIVSIGT